MKDLQRELSSSGTTVIWRKSSYSGSGDQCVEVAALPASRYALRDSKDPHGPALLLAEHEWHALLSSVREGA
jgi:hypothetical protein